MFKRPVLILLCALVLGPAWSALAGLDPSLVAWWSFDEGAGTVAADGTGNGNDGTLNGDPAWVLGMLGMALDFEGTNSYVAAPHIPFNSSSFTQAMWINPQLTNNEEVVFAQVETGSTNLSMHYRIYGDGRVRMGFYSNDLDTPALLEAGEWAHITFWYDVDDQNRRVYINGSIEAEGSANPYLGSVGETRIGQWNNSQWFNGIIDDVQVYDRPLEDAEVLKIMEGLADQSLAGNPSPVDEATDIPRDVVLGWDAGEFAATRDVYFGTTFDDVNDGIGTLVSPGQTALTLDPDGLLDFGQTYYWRVDEVNAAPDNTVFKGDVWSFTVEPFAYPIEGVIATSNGVSEAGAGIDKTVDGSGLNAAGEHSTAAADMWLALPGADPLTLVYEFDAVYKLHEMLVWNYNVMFELVLGFGLKDVTVEYSTDGAEWMVLGDVVIAQATATTGYTANTAIAFEGVAAKYVRLTVSSGWGPMGQFGLSEVRFMQIPAQAREPQPEDGETGVAVGTALNWRAGREAVSHDIYLSMDEAAVADGTALAGSATETTFAPGNLEFGSTYSWKVNEVNEADAVSVWEGFIWSFSTEEYALIDDMEAYTDDEGSRIYESWVDGYGVPANGSQVGYLESPFAEDTIVNSGAQSMPLFYDNTGGAASSEATKSLGGMNLTANGADSLRLFVSGSAPTFYEGDDGTILMNAIGNDIWNAADQFRFAYKQLTGDGSMIARVDDLDNSPSSWAKAGVMIRQETAVGSVHGFMCMTGGDGNGASWQGRETANGSSVNTDSPDPVAPPYWVRIDRSGDTLTGFYSPDGETWTQLGDPRTIEMDDPVLIGLALTSHNSNQATGAAFSNVSITGAAGAWEIAEIGVDQPEGNDPAAVYVKLGSSKVTLSDAAATARSGWTEYVIPLSEFGGNLTSVQDITVGGEGPGAGLVFIDDVGYGRPAPVVEPADDATE